MNDSFLGFRKSLLGILGFFVILAIMAVLKVSSGFIQTFVIALLLSFILNPLVESFVRIKIPRILAILLVIVVLLGVTLLIGLILFQSFQSIIAQYGKYQARFLSLVAFLTTEFDLPENLISTFEITRTVATLLVNISGEFIGVLGNVALTFVFLLFIMLEKPLIKKKLLEAFKTEKTEKISKMFGNMNQQVARYLMIKFFVSLLTGVIIYIGFSIIGLDFPFVWGVLTFLFNFIPTIGSIVITSITAVFALIQFFPEWNLAVGALAIMVTTQMLIGNILDPKLTGDSLNLSPVVILLALLLWGWLWGTSGLFLAVPLTVAMKIIFEYIPGLEFLGIVMGTGALPPNLPNSLKEEDTSLDALIDS
jgi:AI-2 transport protein TqsA